MYFSRSDSINELLSISNSENTENKAYDDPQIISNYDQFLDVIGDFGWWQFLVVATLMLPSMSGGIIVLLSSFTVLEPRAFRCALEVREKYSIVYIVFRKLPFTQEKK